MQARLLLVSIIYDGIIASSLKEYEYNNKGEIEDEGVTTMCKKQIAYIS